MAKQATLGKWKSRRNVHERGAEVARLTLAYRVIFQWQARIKPIRLEVSNVACIP
jgi:hypothetical protein